MSLSNNLKKQVDVPVWEWCRLLPAVSSGLSATCTADNSLYHVTFGRYIYFLQAAATTSNTTALSGFFRYDTISDSYQLLAQPPVAPVVYSGMQFAGGQGYFGNVLGNGGGLNTLQIAGLTGKALKGFDIRIIGGTGIGQQRIVSDVSDPTVWEIGTATAVAATPQGNITDINKNWIPNQWVGYQLHFVSSAGTPQTRKIMYNSSNTIYFADVAKFAEDPWAWSPVVTNAASAETIASATAGSQTTYYIESSILTVDSNWATVPDATSRFVVRGGGIWLISQNAAVSPYTLQYYDILEDQWYIRNACNLNTGPVPAIGTDGTIVNSGENATVWERGTATVSGSDSTHLGDTTKSWKVNMWAGYYVRIFSGMGENQYRVIISNTSNALTVSAWSGITPDATTKYFIEAFEMGTLSSAGAMTQTGTCTTGTINGSVFTAAGDITGHFYQGQILSGTGVQSTKTILSAPADCFTVGLSQTVNFVSGNPSSLGIVAGMIVSINNTTTAGLNAGTGTLAAASAGATYVTGVSSNTVTLSVAPTTALYNCTLQFTTGWVSTLAGHTSVGNTITLASGNTTGLFPGMYLTVGYTSTAGSFTVGTYVAQIISSTIFTTSVVLSAQLSGNSWIQAQGYHTVIGSQLSGVPSGAGTYSVFPSQVVVSTAITATGVGTVTDTSKIWTPNRWTNYAIRIKSGPGIGQARQILGTVSDGTITYTSGALACSSVGTTITVNSTTGLVVNHQLNVTAGTGAFAYGTYVVSIVDSTHFISSAVPTTALSSATITGSACNTLLVYPAWTVAPTNASIYVIHGDTDKNYFSTATQTPTFVHNIDSDTVTTGRQLDRGVARGVSAQYSDWEPIAISSGVPVLQSTGGYGYVAPVAVISGSVTSNIATIIYNTTASAIFPVGSWITMTGQAPAAYAGTWQVIDSSVGVVKFYIPTSPAVISTVGTVGQAASFNLAVGTLAGGNWTQFGNGTLIATYGFVPTTFTGASFTVAAGVSGGTATSYGGYQSSATASGSGTTISLSGGTVGLIPGAIPYVTAGTGAFAVGTVVLTVSTNSFTINNSPSQALSGATVTVYPSVAVTAATPIGTPTTYGVVQKTPQITTAMSGSGSTVTLATSATVFPVGSWIVVTNASCSAGGATGNFNGIYQVTGGTPGVNVQYASSAIGGTVVNYATVGIATQTQLVTTVNNLSLQTGFTVTHSGDQGYTASVNNVAGAITIITPSTVGTAVTQYTYPVGAPAAPMFVYTQTLGGPTTLCDGSKNWVVNQWAGCQVTYNSTQMTAVAAPVQPNVLTGYILANTSNTLILAAAHTAAPATGVSRYVITAPATFPIGNTIGSQDSGLCQGAQLITQLQDVTKSWIMPAPIAAVTVNAISNGSPTCATTTAALMNGILVGMTVAVTTGNVSLPLGTTIIGISGQTLTLSNNFTVVGGVTATLTIGPTANSSGNVVTVTGYPLTNLAVGMRLAITSTTNFSSYVLSTGALVLNAGTNFTSVTVTGITSTTTVGGIITGGTFTISAVPIVPLLNATVQATFWTTNQWIGRRVRFTSGATVSNSTLCEAIITANTTNTLTYTTTTTAVSHGSTGYAIMQQPVVRGLGTALLWNFGSSNLATIGKYLYQARGGNLSGFDRINLNNDKWEFLAPTPGYEPLATGAMYAYDGADRIYFTVQVTQRVYYLDLENMGIHAAGMYPYVAGTATVGNRMEIFETVDGLKYLWLNRHSFQECFRQLLWY